MKAWYVEHLEKWAGDSAWVVVVIAETRGKALFGSPLYDRGESISAYRVTRAPEFDQCEGQPGAARRDDVRYKARR